LEIRNYLMNGIYSWFIPLESNAIYKKIVEANKKFHQRHMTEVNKRIGKLSATGDITVESGVDAKGEQYVDYNYDDSESTKLLQVGVLHKQKRDSQTTLMGKQRIVKGKSDIVDNFHLFLVGLDLSSFTKSQLKVLIHEELNRKAGKILIDSVQFIDTHSLLNKIYTESNSWEKAYEIMRKCGSVCIVRFEEIMDAIKLLVNDVTLRLPLSSEADRVQIHASKFLAKYIEDYN